MGMDMHDSHAFTRRVFLSRGVTLASAALTVPAFLETSARALAAATPRPGATPGVPEDRILVVIQLAGGNDGLNTVIPLGLREYYDGRPGIGVPENEILRLDTKSDVGLHPALSGLKALHEDGLLAIAQGVGYPNPNRSHFLSMDIWHTADTNGTGDGWLGKYFDSQCAGRDPKRPGGAGVSRTPREEPSVPQAEGDGLARSGIAIGRTAPRALEGRLTKPIAFESPELFRWTGEGLSDAMGAAYAEVTKSANAVNSGADSAHAFLTRTAMDAQIASDRIRKAVEGEPLVEYPRGELGRQLQMIGAMIRAGLSTRVYYATLGGFDTHAAQGGAAGRHAQLLGEFGASLRAFTDDLRAQGNLERVLTMTFSEFGRRVRQNASGGTDHGAAAPMFLTGPMVRPGALNRHPSLTDLDDGDLKFGVDFRSVYAGVLKEWLRADPNAILGRPFPPARLLKA